MSYINRIWLRLAALFQLCRYDVTDRLAGFDGNYQGLRCLAVSHGKRERAILPGDISQAIDFACTIYWKPVLCLQRSVAEARLLRLRGWNAEVVMGYRAMPFAGHAWVEIEGVPVSGSREYQRQLLVLERIGAAADL